MQTIEEKKVINKLRKQQYFLLNLVFIGGIFFFIAFLWDLLMTDNGQFLIDFGFFVGNCLVFSAGFYLFLYSKE